jgi:hypothetical protein
MEQEDYLLRGIEKMGAVLRAILNRLTGTKGNIAFTTENAFEQTSEELNRELGFDLSRFISLDKADSDDYLSRFEGMNTANLESLAEIIYQTAGEESVARKRILLDKALQIYHLCETNDKTFSFDRGQRIKAIQNAQRTISTKKNLDNP